MKSVAAHQPNLYPYGGFFAKAASVDEFVIVDTAQYVKKEYHNRNKVKFTDGSAKWLFIPVKNAGRYRQAINEAEIDKRCDWRRVHLRTLEMNYRKAPFFEEFFPTMKELLSADWEKLSLYNIALIKKAMEYLGIATPLSIASEKGMREGGRELILEICGKTGSDTYLHGIHSLDYADFDFLSSNGVKNLVQSFTPSPYPQINGAFIPNLSVLDIIFNCGKKASLDAIKKSSKINIH